jgi:hypothetical protein
MTDTPITTWTVNAAPDGSPLVSASPTDIDMERADAVLRINASARRYAVEAVRADVATGRRLAATALANVFPDANAWQHVRPGDLVPAAPAEPPAKQPQPEPLDAAAIRPDHPRWAAEAAELLQLGYRDADEREAAREKLVKAALAEGWSLRDLGHAILREQAEAYERTYVSPLQHRSDDAQFGAEPDPATLWQRVTRPPAPGEVTNATRRAF